MQILSIQSAVAYGHVGNSAAVFPLQRLGHEVVPVNTVLFSNHTGYGSWRGPVLTATEVREILLGVEERGALADIDLVLSGYQGDPEIAEVIAEAVARVRAANPRAVYACDPVLGNARRGCFVDPALPALIRDRMVPHADIITPNQFELGELTGTAGLDASARLEDVLAAADAARELGPTTILVTSVMHRDQPEEEVSMLVVTPIGAWTARTPRLPLEANGSGDVTAALFAAHLVAGSDPADALARTLSSVYDLLENTVRSGAGELRLVQSQETFAHPRLQFPVTQVR